MLKALRSARRARPSARLKRPFALALALAALVTAGLVDAAPAQADSGSGCTYPRVCFYPTEAYVNASHPTAAYKDITSYWQTLGYQAHGAAIVFNTRHDDGALLHFTNGTTVCDKPGWYVNAGYYGTVDKIRIMDSATC